MVEQVEEERQIARLSHTELYQAAGIPKSTYGSFTNGSRAIDFATAERLARALGLTVGELVARAEVRIVEDLTVTTVASGDAIAIPLPASESAPRQTRVQRGTSTS